MQLCSRVQVSQPTTTCILGLVRESGTSRNAGAIMTLCLRSCLLSVFVSGLPGVDSAAHADAQALDTLEHVLSSQGQQL